MKVLVWLSGWVDSAVSAYLLKKAWYDVEAWFMINYKNPQNKNCNTKIDLQESKNIAKYLGIKLHIFDFVDIYEHRILNYVYEEYSKWNTPNPDVFCNNLIKFDIFLEKALSMWFDFISTWHYAQILKFKIDEFDKKTTIEQDFIFIDSDILDEKINKNENINIGDYIKVYKNFKEEKKSLFCDIEKCNNIFLLKRSPDNIKDQSYFLSRLNQYQLSKSIFPVWNLNKNQVRYIANKIWLPNANRPDSQWLCFIWKVKLQDFLAKKIPPKVWDVFDLNWNKIWKHNGAYYFTIGQNKWLNLGRKVYVTNIDIQKNNLTVSFDGNDPILYKEYIFCKNRTWNINIDPKILQQKTIKCKIRHTQELFEIKFEKLNIEKNQKINIDNKYESYLDIVKIVFCIPIKSVPNWQIVVCYLDDFVLGSGVICW